MVTTFKFKAIHSQVPKCNNDKHMEKVQRSSSKMGFLDHVALNDPTPGKRVHSMTPPSEQLKEISQVALNDPSLRTA